MYPPQSPTSIAGQLESNIRQIENELRRKANEYEVNSLNRNVVDLADTIRTLGSVVDGLINRLEACEEEMRNHKIEHE